MARLLSSSARAPGLLGLDAAILGHVLGRDEVDVDPVQIAVLAGDDDHGRGRADQPEDDQQDHRRGQHGDLRVAAAPAPEPLGPADRPRHDRLAGAEAAEVLGHRRDVGIPPRRVLLERPQADRLQVARHPRQELRGGHRLGVADQVERVQDRRPPERRPAGEHLVERGPQGVLVGGRPGLLGPARLLGGHVAGRAEDRPAARLGRVGLQPLDQPEVGDLGRPVAREQDVGRLDVAVDDPAAVGHVHGPGQRLDDPGRVLDGLRLGGDPLRQAAPIEELQREIGQAVVLADLEDLDDVRVVDGGDGAGLGLEAGQVAGSRAGAGEDHLERDQAVEPGLPRLVDDPHAALAQHPQDLVAGDPRQGDIASPGRSGGPLRIRRRHARRVHEAVGRVGVEVGGRIAIEVRRRIAIEVRGRVARVRGLGRIGGRAFGGEAGRGIRVDACPADGRRPRGSSGREVRPSRRRSRDRSIRAPARLAGAAMVSRSVSSVEASGGPVLRR